MAPLALVARPGLMSFPRVVYEQAVSYLQTTRTILIPCGVKMILSGLFVDGKVNIYA